MERRSAAAVFGLWTLVREVRRAPGDGLVEQEADIAQQGRLVALDSEQVVRVAVEQIAGQHGPGEQGTLADSGDHLEDRE